jgi:hypothetical protein
VGHHLPGASIAGEFTNQIPEQYLPLGALLGQTLTSTVLTQAQAMFPSIHIPFTGFTGTLGQALKPFPQYGGVSNPWLDVGNSAYHSLQVTLNKRLSSGLTFMINYTFSKELDDLAGARDPNKDYLERAPGSIDHPQVAAATFVYQLPFGAGKKWNASNKILSSAMSHWQFSGIFTFSSGAPLTVSDSNCTSGGILGTCFPNYNPSFSGPIWQNGTIGQGNLATTVYLNKSAFVDPPAYTVGNVARSAPFNLFAPHTADVDISVRREFRVVERVRLAFQADAFNINNAVHFGAPGPNIDSASFGIVSSQANQARKLQFSARVSF